MRYRRLGRSGLMVSEIGLGSWLTYGTAVTEDVAKACVHRAFDLGVNFFDTANEYGAGKAEETLGSILSSFPRSSYVLATKVYWPMGDGPNDWGLSRKHVTEQLHASLARLGVDYVDLYQCHRFDTQRPLEETLSTMNDLVRRGDVLYWGVSEWTADQIAEAVAICRREGWEEPRSNQPMYNPLWRSIERGVMPVCETLGLGLVVFSPLALGVLSGKYLSPDSVPAESRAAGPPIAFYSEQDEWKDLPFFRQPVLDAVQRLKPVAEKANCTVAQLSLAWILRSSAVSSVITGASRVTQVEDNAAASDLEVDPALLEEVSEILRPVADFTSPTMPNMDD
ncbi:MAG: aldo/keto reductase family protein [Actinomycetota bacterium]